ncbi:ecto-ADP-ribosyltransferase 5-like [Polypterus senegalus]|uniref:ecto-ADP-ribosyltransferase 5-like n=1 Tax=Polypterus senegalus TaxID=55291 RepID=UPI00196698EA|nr:ecto-ADP-ribosyltransferase 5-like [Polypterus senegalus]XP_039631032.1 ecto-ADP-ribosyltransferase 5-like [Polypterus senegalus]
MPLHFWLLLLLSHQVLWTKVKSSSYMHESSYDDDYKGCQLERKKEVKESFLTYELNNNTAFRCAWNKAEEYWKSKTFPSGVDKEVLLAITAYTSNSCYAKFNEAVESGVFTVMNGHYRSLHFLLTMAMENFKVNACVTSYRGVMVEIRPKIGEAFRFGRFASSSRSRAATEVFGKKTVFIITTCYGMDIARYSLFPLENEVLIHPYEEFEVTAVNNSEVTLLSRKTTVNYRCAPLSGSPRIGITTLEVGLCTSFIVAFQIFFSPSIL